MFGRVGGLIGTARGGQNIRKIRVIESKAPSGRCVSRSFRDKSGRKHVFYARLGGSADLLALPGEQTGWEAIYVTILCQNSAWEAIM